MSARKRSSPRVLLLALLCLPVATASRAEFMPAAAPGLNESGAPVRTVQTPEALGMSSFPTDLAHLPDGRVAIASPTEIVIGDGFRWDLYHRVEGGDAASGRLVTDAEGNLYMALRGGVGRVQLLPGGRFSVERLFSLTPSTGSATVILNNNVWVGKNLYWYGNAGAIVRWQPGSGMEEVARVDVADLLFSVKGRLFLSNFGSNALSEIQDGKLTRVEELARAMPFSAVNAAVAFDEERALVAVHPGGLFLFDGSTFTAFPSGQWGGRNRINDLVSVGDGLFAAAVDGEGVLFFDRNGKTLQAVDKATDSRFARVQRMVANRAGVLWVLLNEGVARIHFPSMITRYDESISSGLRHSAPLRWQGRLWLLADGRAVEGRYDADGRLVGFDDRSPPAKFIFKIAAPGDHLLAGTELGLFERLGNEWRLVVPDLINARVELAPDRRGRYWYTARGEMGWLSPLEEGKWARQGFPDEKLTDAYNVVREGDSIWLELGGNQIGRIDVSGVPPRFERFGAMHGLPEGWCQLFESADGVRVLVGGRTLRFDEASRSFQLDTGFMERNPWVVGAIGRPAIDAKGRQWYTNLSFSRALEPDGAGGMRTVLTTPPGITPLSFVMEDDGVVWMGQRGRLMRYDPRWSAAAPPKPKALITRVEFPTERHTAVLPRETLGPIAFRDNSPTFFFMAPGNELSAPATFEFRMEGGENRWISTGVSGMAAFHRLYEGKYRLHLRTLVAGVVQDETSLEFSILPPWYRHPFAYFGYGLLLLGGLLGTASMMTYLQRREKSRLEKLVDERTRAVQQANRQLAQQVAETMAKSNELRESEERYRALYDNNPAMYFTLSAGGEVLSVNLFGAEHLGYRAEELIGGNVKRVIHPDDHGLLDKVVAQCLATPGRSFAWQVRKVTRKGATMFVKEMARAVLQADGRMILFVVCEDISANVKLEDQLRQAQKMEAVGQLAGGVAHDFNNLLTVIQGQAEWVEQYASTEEERREGLQQIRLATAQATKLTRQLLVFSRRQAMQVERADLNELVIRVTKLLERVIGEDIKVATDFRVETAFASVDSGMIEQVLVNLTLNARDAMPQGGQIRIAVDRIEAGFERVAGRPGCRPGPHVCIEFSDTGVGIGPDVLPRIFEPFYTTKAPGQGTGLGLATSASILSQHNGWIEVESAEKRGTVFRLFLPSEARPPAAPVKEEATPAAPGVPLRVLLVEDEAAVRTVAKRLLEKFGYHITEASNADEALVVWRANEGRFDILLTDILMPGSMNGRALATQLQTERPALSVCIMTGHDPEMLARKEGQPALQAPHLMKPFTRQTLLAALEKAAAKVRG